MQASIEQKDGRGYRSESDLELDALFRQNLVPVEVDVDKLWYGVQARIARKQEARSGWFPQWNHWLETLAVFHPQTLWSWQRPLAVASTLLLLLFSSWLLHDQSYFNEQVQILKQIDTTWRSESLSGQSAGEENPFVLSEENTTNTNPFNTAS